MFDDEAAAYDEDDSDEEEESNVNDDEILSGVQKVLVYCISNQLSWLIGVIQLRKIIRAVRSSPQRKRSWLQQVSASLRENKPETSERALMVILDVKTRWSSTHQMMGMFMKLNFE